MVLTQAAPAIVVGLARTQPTNAHGIFHVNGWKRLVRALLCNLLMPVSSSSRSTSLYLDVPASNRQCPATGCGGLHHQSRIESYYIQALHLPYLSAASLPCIVQTRIVEYHHFIQRSF